MHNAFIQAAVGFIPVMLFFVLLSIFSKKARIRNICVAVVAAIVPVTGLALGLPQLSAEESAIAQYDGLQLVYAVAEEESPELAQAMLEDLLKDYKEEYALCAARLAVQSGDIEIAKALYQKVLISSPDIASEYDEVLALAEAASDYYSMDNESDGAAVAAAYTKAYTGTVESIQRNVRKFTSQTEDNVYEKAAVYIAYADQAHKDYLTNQEFDDSEAVKQLRKLNTLIEENPGLASITQLRLARLKLQILCGDYKDIAANVDEHSDYNELLIVSELYLNNYVKKNHFSGGYSSDNIGKYEAVYNKLDEIYGSTYQDKSREERNAAKSQLSALKSAIKNPVLGKLEEELISYAETENALDASKVYLQTAKIEHSLGNETKVAEYLDRSIDTVGDCEDSDYTVPMYELVGIITDKDDPERLKGAADYVEQVLDNNMTVKLSPQAEENVGSPGADEGEDDSLAGDFAGQMQTYVSQKRMSVKIVNVDTTDFDQGGTIRATVNISNNLYTSPDELKAALGIRDCGVDITDFTIEKVNYTGANILLCVDTSGSMSDSNKIGYLKDAIALFVADMTAIESISLVTFSSDIERDYPFGTSTDELTAAAEAIGAGGGTSIFHSVIYSIGKFTKSPGVINSIIVMSDGLDGYNASMAEIEERIGAPCNQNGITVYAIGFGNDADSSYLNAIAASTGGAYLFANEPGAYTQTNQLSAFFEGLRAQILNQYTITFKAKDTLSYSRELRVNVGQGLDGDRVTYYLGGGEDSITEPDFNEDSPLFMNEKVINGFQPRLLYKNGKTLTTTLKGAGFSAADSIGVALKGNTTGVEWDLKATYVDENTVTLTIPAGIGADVYDAHVSVNGKTAVLTKGLAVFTQGSEQVTDFGAYRFVSYQKQESKGGGAVTLSGYVTMNGWLNFLGDITLSGDLSGHSISLTDPGGSYVRYDASNAEGLASVLGNIGLPVAMPPLGILTLYNEDVADSGTGDVRVEAFPLNALDLGNYLMFTQIQAKLYPNRAEFETQSLAATLPFANQILRNKLDLFSFDVEAGVTVSSKKIGCKIDVEFEAGDSMSSSFSQINFGNMPVYVSLNEYELHVDTMANDYHFLFKTDVAFLSGLGLSVKWDNPDSGDRLNNPHSNGLIPTEVLLYIDRDINSTIAGVPVTWSDFMVGLTDIDTSKHPVYWTLTGGFDLSAVKITAYEPLKGLKEWIGDVSIASIDDAVLTLNLGEAHFKAVGNFKLLEELDFGSLELELGKFSYTCALLGMNNEPVEGIRAKATLGPKWRFGDSTLTMQGAAEVDGMNRFLGIQLSGQFEAKFKVWIISISSGKIRGEIAVGFRRTADGTVAFVVRSAPWNADLTWPKNVAGKL